jgi:hypothetical protein
MFIFEVLYFFFKWKLNVHVCWHFIVKEGHNEYSNLKGIFIVDKEVVDDAKNMWDEDSGFKNKKQKSHNFNQNPKRFFFYLCVYGYVHLQKKWDFYVFVLGCWHVLLMFVTCRHFIVDEGQNETLIWKGLFHSWWWK